MPPDIYIHVANVEEYSMMYAYEIGPDIIIHINPKNKIISLAGKQKEIRPIGLVSSYYNLAENPDALIQIFHKLIENELLLR
jgi:hypothetical protein